MVGRLRRAYTPRMDVLAALVGWRRIGKRWVPGSSRSVDMQPDASFPIRPDALALIAKGLAYEQNYRLHVLPAGIEEWNRLWPEHPAYPKANP